MNIPVFLFGIGLVLVGLALVVIGKTLARASRAYRPAEPPQEDAEGEAGRIIDGQQRDVVGRYRAASGAGPEAAADTDELP
jgi:hypothetical protein